MILKDPFAPATSPTEQAEGVARECGERFEEAFATRSCAWDVQVRIAALGVGLSVARGESTPACAEGEALVFVASGATKLLARTSLDREQVLSFHFAGDLVTVPASAEHSYLLVALSDSQLLVFPARRFLEAVSEEPQLLAELHRRATSALSDSRDDSVGLGRKTAQERLARFLLQMADRIGHDNGNGIAIELPMARGEIAACLGLTIETVSRQFSELRQAGLIEVSGRSGVKVLDQAGLAQCAGQCA